MRIANPLQGVGAAVTLVAVLLLAWQLWASKNQWLQPARDIESFIASNQAPPRTPCKVLTVYDGDTIGCDLNGNNKIDPPQERIRLLGIDTPEMHYSQKNKTGRDEPGAVAASEFTTRVALHKQVYLTFESRRFDRYGRTLAHVYLTPQGGVSINHQLLEGGFATKY